MTVTSHIPVLVRRWLVCLALTVPLAACAHHRVDTLVQRYPECLSDEGAVRACLVPERETNGEANKLVADDCYWLSHKDVRQYRRENIHLHPRNFSFTVVNKCSKSAKVRFLLGKQLDPDPKRHLEFLTNRCKPVEGADGWGELANETITTEFGLTCMARPYKKESRAERTRRFNLVVTHYNGSELKAPVEFDPEVVLEKAGEP